MNTLRRWLCNLAATVAPDPDPISDKDDDDIAAQARIVIATATLYCIEAAS